MFKFLKRFVFCNKLYHIILINLLVITIPVTSIEVKEDVEENGITTTDDPQDFDHNPENTRIDINASLASPPEIQIKETSRITIPNYYRESIHDDDRTNFTSSASTPSSVISTPEKNNSFNPSPQVFEYNTYPVLPAYPEAKHVHSELFHTNNLRPYLPPAPVPVPMTYSTPRSSEYLPPTSSGGSIPAKKPYSGEYLPPTSSGGSIPAKKPYSGEYLPPTSFGGSTSAKKPYSGGVGTWFSSVGIPESRNPVLVKDQPYPFHISGHGSLDLERPSFGKPSHSSYLPPSAHKEHEHHGISPWKKVITFITTLLPIGLFLTALTPTILTVQPGNLNNESTNLKTTRLLDVDNTLIELLEGRSEDTSGCHQTRLLCEAATKGRDPGATNLQKSLWLIASQSYEETRGPKEFMKLFYAIKGNKCDELPCNFVTNSKT